MKTYISPYPEMLLCTDAGMFEFANHKYAAKNKDEIKAIEESKDFGKYIFPYEAEEESVKNEEFNENDEKEEKEDKIFKCEVCDAEFTTNIALIGHMRSHEPKKDKK